MILTPLSDQKDKPMEHEEMKMSLIPLPAAKSNETRKLVINGHWSDDIVSSHEMRSCKTHQLVNKFECPNGHCQLT
nr:hypothetical protein BgiMline_015749 [Biomphalaria glabrata]